MVVPSGALLATARVATAPPAPGRFSITIWAMSASLILSLTLRATVLALPPGANGMTSVIGRPEETCADADGAARMAPAASRSRIVRIIGILVGRGHILA